MSFGIMTLDQAIMNELNNLIEKLVQFECNGNFRLALKRGKWIWCANYLQRYIEDVVETEQKDKFRKAQIVFLEVALMNLKSKMEERNGTSN